MKIEGRLIAGPRRRRRSGAPDANTAIDVNPAIAAVARTGPPIRQGAGSDDHWNRVISQMLREAAVEHAGYERVEAARVASAQLHQAAVIEEMIRDRPATREKHYRQRPVALGRARSGPSRLGGEPA